MTDHEPSQRLTMSLIEKCIRGSSIMKGAADERASDLLKIQVLRLDWQRIASINNLDIFTHLRELYLQQNRIHVIEELDTLSNLEFLALGSNNIRRLENLRHLHKLQVLDLSNNVIEDIDTQELPRALVIFNLVGNPCCSDPDIRRRVTSSLQSLMILDDEAVERWPHTTGVEESKGPIEGKQLTLGGEEDGDNGRAVVLYISVLSGSECSIVPFRFSAAGNVEQIASSFCADNSLSDDTAKDSLVVQMKEAIEEDRLDKKPARNQHPVDQPKSDEEADERDPTETDHRLRAVLHLQRARTRVMQESMTSFEEHKKHLMTATRKLVKRKKTAAHDRSEALESDIKKIVENARRELQLRRTRMSVENKEFAAAMRNKVDQVLAARRRETESTMGVTAIDRLIAG
ncbi:unnamed protein product [Hapterophycus canaliculatus]